MLKRILPGFLVILLGIFLFRVGGDSFTRNTDAKFARSEWPTTQGTIISSSVHRVANDDLDITVRFRYDVDGTRYADEQTWPVGEIDFPGSIPPELKQLESKYAPGTVVRVYYDPTNPAQAVVEPRQLEVELALLCPFYLVPLGWVLLFVGLWMILRAVIRRNAV